MSEARLVDESLFAEGDGLALAGSRCRTCSTVTFPRQDSCPRCAGVDVEVHALATEGTIWAFTEHVAIWGNENILLTSPLCFALLPGAWAQLRGRTSSRWPVST